MKELTDFLRKNYAKLCAAEADCHIGGITFPADTKGLRQFVCLADNVHIKPDSAKSYGIDEGPHQNVVCYRMDTVICGFSAQAIKFMICGRVLGTPDIEEAETFLKIIREANNDGH
jgi:hypothetical protein